MREREREENNDNDDSVENEETENGGQSSDRVYSSPVPYYVTTTMDPFDEEDIQDMVGFGQIPCDNLTKAEIEVGESSYCCWKSVSMRTANYFKV